MFRAHVPAVLTSLALLAIAVPAAAQRVEITPRVGVRLGGQLDRGDLAGPFDDDLDIDDGESLGLSLDIAVGRNVRFELLASRQETRFERESGLFEPDTPVLDLDVEYYQAGALYEWTPGQVRPFVGFGAGATVLDPQEPGLDSETRFSLSVAGGMKVLLTRHLGLRLEGRYYSTLVDDREAIFCDRFGRCFAHHDGSYLGQGEVSAGVILAIP